MSDPSKCLTLFPSTDDGADEAAPLLSETDLSSGRRLGDSTVRVIENWIVAIVTLLSAGVILMTLLAHHDVGRSRDTSARTTIDARSFGR
jgi:hypothetical protein